MSIPAATDTLRKASLYNIRGFGAVMDVQRVTTAATTSGSAIVTGVSPTSAWAGKTVRILGAGTAGTHLTTTVASYTGTSVTLASAPQATLSSATLDWGTDDTAAILAAHTAAQAHASTTGTIGVLYIPEGRTFLTSKIPTCADIHVAGAGTRGSQVILGCDNFWVKADDGTSIGRVFFHDFLIDGGEDPIKDAVSTAESSAVTGSFRIVERMFFDNYCVCAVSDNSSDSPWWKVEHSHFRGYDARQPTGLALGGLTDSCDIMSNEFNRNRISVKLVRAPNSRVWANGMVWSAQQASALGTVTDGAITAGGTVFTSATAAFDSSYVGAGISVTGAGYPSSDPKLNARIVSVTSGTAVVVNLPAYATVGTATTTFNKTPRFKIWIVPHSTVTNAGCGMSIRTNKFGNENQQSGDSAILVADGVIDVSTTDAAMTSGSTTLTSATAAFTSAMVGNYVTVVGALSGGGTAYTSIVSRQSSTQVTLAGTATATVTGAALAVFKGRGARLPNLGTASTGYLIQATVEDNVYQNSGGANNGRSTALITSMTPNIRSCTFGPTNYVQGSGYQWFIEYGPGVAAATDPYHRTNAIGLLIDDDAGQTRLIPAVSNIPGMGGRFMDTTGQMSQRMPSPLFWAGAGGHAGFAQILKTRPSAFTASTSPSSTITTLSGDAEVGSDGMEIIFTAGSHARASLTTADISAGENIVLQFKVAAGSANTIPWAQAIIMQSVGSTLWAEPFDVPTAAQGWRQVTRQFAIPATTANMQLRFYSPVAGQIKIGEPALYHAREPLPLHGFVLQSPNGTIYKLKVNDAGTLVVS